MPFGLDIPGVPHFWSRVESAAYAELLLDYDGTLAPLCESRMAAVPLPGISKALKEINRRADTSLTIVSGRPVHELLTLLGDLDIMMIGSHGYECKPASAQIVTYPLTPAQEGALREALWLAADTGYKALVESKAGSVALHLRGNPERVHIADTIGKRWSRLCSNGDLELRDFNGGIELRAVGRNKGLAVREKLQTGFPGALAVYIGDDETDEDAFLEVNKLAGVTIRVGTAQTKTHAQGLLPDCESVERLLCAWATRISPVKPEGASRT